MTKEANIDHTRLNINPWDANTNLAEPHMVWISYGQLQPLPQSVFIKAETNGVANPPISKNLKILFLGCEEQPDIVSNNILIYYLHTGSEIVVDLPPLFKEVTSGIEFCNKREFWISDTKGGNKTEMVGLMLDGELLKIGEAAVETTSVHVVVRMASFLKASKQLVLREGILQASTIYSGNQTELNKANKILHKVPCNCAQVDLMGSLIRATVQAEMLTSSDMGPHPISVYIGSHLLISLVLEINTHENLYQANLILEKVYPLYKEVEKAGKEVVSVA